MTIFLRGIQSVKNVDGDIELIKREAPLSSHKKPEIGLNPRDQKNRLADVNFWIDGLVRCCTTHYNPGPKKYYSPVGLIIEAGEGDIMSNYAGDGNTSTLHCTNTNEPFVELVKDIDKTLKADETLKLIFTKLNPAYPPALKEDEINSKDYVSYMNTLSLALEYAYDDDSNQEEKRVLQAIQKKLQALALKHLKEFYLSTGLNPLGTDLAKLADIEKGIRDHGSFQDAKYLDSTGDNKLTIYYTETVLYVKDIGKITGVYYDNGSENPYPPKLINDAWKKEKDAKDYLNNRKTSAQEVISKLKNAGVANPKLKVLEQGQLKDPT